jgi:hypothetical protein
LCHPAGQKWADLFGHRSTVFGELRSAVSVEQVRNDKKTVDQTDAENRADLFRVHLLRRRGLTEEILSSNDCTGGSTERRALVFATPSQTQSAMQSATQSFTADHMTP